MPPKKKAVETPVEEITEQESVDVTPPSDETDLKIATETGHGAGPGDDPTPESDFDSYATPGVHIEDKTTDEVAVEVLAGKWGDYNVLRDRLIHAGHDDAVVMKKVNQRLMKGAPSAYKPSQSQIVDQIERGEWGEGTDTVLSSRLLGAGFKAADVADIVRRVRRG